MAQAWLQWAREQQLIPKILAHVQADTPEPPLSRVRRGSAHRSACLLHALASASEDPGFRLLPLLAEGVPTGALSELPRSMQWPPKENADLPHELTECVGDWKAAEAEPETVSALLEEEISNGRVVRTDMSVEQARQHWHKGIAVGKLNVVHAEGKEPRLVLDSTVCGVNPKRNIPERVSLPMASDVRLAFMPGDTHASFIGASLSTACYSSVFADTLYHYRVCHFGARFSAYWWQRVLTQAATRGVISTPTQSLVVRGRPFGRIAPPGRASTTCSNCHALRGHQCANFLEKCAIPALPNLVRMVH